MRYKIVRRAYPAPRCTALEALAALPRLDLLEREDLGDALDLYGQTCERYPGDLVELWHVQPDGTWERVSHCTPGGR